MRSVLGISIGILGSDRGFDPLNGWVTVFESGERLGRFICKTIQEMLAMHGMIPFIYGRQQDV